MRVILIGASGTIGKATQGKLSEKYEVITAGRNSGDLQVDISSEESINSLFDQAGSFDALVCAAGALAFSPLETISYDDFLFSFNNKLMGQIQLVLKGMKKINDGGSFSLTSGILSEEGIPTCSAAATVNAAIHGFVKTAAVELPRGIRINAISPTLVTESVPVYGDYFPGFKPVPALDVADAYYRSVAGKQTGRVYAVGY
jgi:NAD(P)-dependent dehydrogenase (short-subunit alcohol dehydrogenase family)